MRPKDVAIACVALMTGLTCAAPRSAFSQSLYCNFVNVAVPCERLSEPLYLDGVVPWVVRYRFSKWVPIWPNQAIFGPVTGQRAFEYPNSWLEQIKYKLQVDEYFNRTIDKPNPRDTIEGRTLSSNLYGKNFVDADLAEKNDKFHRGLKSNLVSLDQSVFRGTAVFDAWLRSISAGIICANEERGIREYLARRCAFTRTKADGITIEYCSFTETILQKVRDQPICVPVASENRGKRAILATRYTGHDAHVNAVVASSESRLTCDLPSKYAAAGFQQLRTFLEQYLGPTSRLQMEKNHLEGEGMKIAEVEEGGFLRAYFYAWTDNGGSSSSIELHPSFTFSAQASDDITDYRELNKASAMRVLKRFYTKFFEEIKAAAPGALCRP